MNALALGNSAMDWVLWNSAGAAVVVLLVLVSQFLLKDRISARWRYNLWILVLVRLVLPALPAVRMHVPQWANLQPPSARVLPSRPELPPAIMPQPAEAETVTTIVVPADLHVIDIPHDSAAITPNASETARVSEAPVATVRATGASASPATPAATIRITARRSFDWKTAFLSVWLTGLTVMLLRLASMSVRLAIATRRCQPIRDPASTELLASCCQAMGVRRIPELLMAPMNSGPALVGMWKPRLLLPHCVVNDFPRGEIRLILLHELAHLKRRDVAVNYLLAILQAVHWFNPLVWLAFWRMREERELACDEAVLRLTPVRERRAYGGTILKLIEVLCRGSVPAGALGVIQHNTLMHRRIAMIAHFNGTRRNGSATGVMLSLLLIGAAAVSAVRAQQAPPAPSLAPVPTEPKDRNPAVDQARQAVEAAGTTPQQPALVEPPTVELGPATPNPLANPAAPPLAGAPPGIAPAPNQPLAGMPQNPHGATDPIAAQPPDGAILTVEDAAANQANAKTTEKLKRPQAAQFNGLPFRDVLTNLADASGIDIVVDEKALADVGVDSSAAAVTMNIREPRPLEQVLELAMRLASRDLDYSLVNGVVFVSTRVELARHVITLRYGVGNGGDRDELINLILNTLGRNQGIRLAYLGDKLIVTAPEPSQRELGKLLTMVADQGSSANHIGRQPQGQTSATPSSDRVAAVMNDLVPRMQQLANEAIATSAKFGPRSPQMQIIAGRLDLIGQELAMMGEQMSKEGRDADVAKLKAAMDQIKATLAPLHSEPEPTAPAVAK